jgi:hypothetical protein
MKIDDSKRLIRSEFVALYRIISRMDDVQLLGEYFIEGYRKCLKGLRSFFEFDIENFDIKEEEIEKRYPIGFSLNNLSATIAITPAFKGIFEEKFVNRMLLFTKMETLIIFLNLKVEG